jgi:hypothetical protein
MRWLRNVFILSLVLFVFGPVARADTYNVNATVPYDTPTIPATYDNSLNGFSSSVRLTRIFGTCQQVFPSSVIAIYRDGVLIGSTTCSALNRYEVVVDLINGQNTLIAKTLNLNGLYGPDSSKVTVIYSPPTERPTPVPGAPAIVVQDANSTLSIITNTPFQVVNSKSKTVSVSISVDGGSNPYVVELNWGDGTVDSRQVSLSGTYIFSHDYSKPGSYTAKASVTDVLGVRREQFFAVVALGTLDQQASKQDVVKQQPSSVASADTYAYMWWILLAVVLVGVGVLAGLALATRTSAVVAKQKQRKKYPARKSSEKK